MGRAAEGHAAVEEPGLAGDSSADLEELRWDLGASYEFGFDDENGWHALRRDGTSGLITAPSPDALYTLVLDDQSCRPVIHDAGSCL
jgi:hypothetical protein